MIKSRVFLAGALLVAAAGTAHAGLTVTPAVVSDYDFRGVTQTANDPAVQVGATYAFDSGLYVGGWGSNIKFGAGDPKLELDWSAGYTVGDAKEGFAYDLGAVYYTYQKSGSDFNYGEVYAGVTRDWFNAKIFYSPDFGGARQATPRPSTSRPPAPSRRCGTCHWCCMQATAPASTGTISMMPVTSTGLLV